MGFENVAKIRENEKNKKEILKKIDGVDENHLPNSDFCLFDNLVVAIIAVICNDSFVGSLLV